MTQRLASPPLPDPSSGDLAGAVLAATSSLPALLGDSRLDTRLLLAVAELVAGSVLPSGEGCDLSQDARELLAGSPAGLPGQDLDRDLFLGSPGTALFLAAFSRVTGDGRCREAALASLAASRAALLAGRPSQPALPTPPIGALVGLCAAIHASLLAGVLLDEPALFGAAHELTELLTPAVLRADRHFDVIFGSAGAVLVLLALDRFAGGPNRAGRTPLDLALECGAHLLAGRAGAGFPRAWATSPGAPPQSGFSHGASGICLALARLHARTGDPAYWHAVLEGAAAERALAGFLPAEGDASPAALLHRVSWCHGAAGILLARLGILALATPREGREALARDLSRALAVTFETRQIHLDHLCCGNLGRVDAWLSLHQAGGGDPQLPARAHALARRVLGALKKRGSYFLDTPAAPASLFRGLPGIGYALLRLADPSSLPSLLLIDDPFFHPLGGASHAPHAQAAPDRQPLL